MVDGGGGGGGDGGGGGGGGGGGDGTEVATSVATVKLYGGNCTGAVLHPSVSKMLGRPIAVGATSLGSAGVLFRSNDRPLNAMTSSVRARVSKT